MPTTNRPFFANFLAAFRAHSALSQKPTTQPGGAAPPTSPGIGAPHPAAARSIATKASAAAAAAAAVQAQAQAQTHSQFHARPSSPVNIPGAHAHAHTHAGPGALAGVARSRTPSATRQAAGAGTGFADDSASESSLGRGPRADKWYIGGRTATGEERYYKLGAVRRYRSCDRLSLDRLSL